MNDVIVLLIGPPLAMFLGLVAWPAGRPALIAWGCGAAVLALATARTLPLAPASGPDDWFHGIEIVPLVAMAVVLVWVGLAQLVRWLRLRAGEPAYYPLWLLGIALIGVAAVLQFSF